MTQPRPVSGLKTKALALAALMLIAAIAFILIRISAVNQAYHSLLATTPAPTLSPPVLNFQATDALFRMGSIGPEVIALQERLTALGYYQGELDGQFGRATQDAISRFQGQNGLEADGMAGSLTLARLYDPEAIPAGVSSQASPTPAQEGEPVYNP
mgnify:FL=1